MGPRLEVLPSLSLKTLAGTPEEDVEMSVPPSTSRSSDKHSSDWSSTSQCGLWTPREASFQR